MYHENYYVGDWWRVEHEVSFNHGITQGELNSHHYIPSSGNWKNPYPLLPLPELEPTTE